MRYIGMNLEDETIDKLKIVSLTTGKNRTELIKEGIRKVIEEHSDSFDKFNSYIQQLKEIKK